MMLGGYANRIAHIDLSSGEINYEKIDEDIARKYVGGRGMGVKFLYDNGPGVEPYSPDNILCMMIGPLTGTKARMNGRLCMVTKSPLTGTCTDSHMGGWPGPRLKWAGFDGLVFRGKSENPVYAYVENGTVALHDASGLWGKGTHETAELMQEKYGKDASVVSIGPAGENKVRLAGWISEENRASARGGTGAVGGSKNLKCVVIKGNTKNSPEPLNPEVFNSANQKAFEKIKEIPITSPKTGDLHLIGTNVLANLVNEIGAYPTRNAQGTRFPQTEFISGERVVERILTKRIGCYMCPVACKKQVTIMEGKHKGLQMESMEYESVWAFGAMCGNADPDSIAAMIDRCNDYGLDTIDTGDALAMTMEASQKGLVDGISWGDTDGMLEMIHNIAYREGVGDYLAEGLDPCSSQWGDTSIAMTVKGQGIPAYDPRGLQGMGIGFATSNRGACHLRAYTPAVEVLSHALGERQPVDPLEWKGKGQLLGVVQNVYSFTDSLDLCKFTTFSFPLDTYTGFYSSMTGVNLDSNGLLKIGERIYNLERYYNNLNGFREGSDYLPKRFLEEPGEGAAEGKVCQLDKMLEEYYAFRGWNNGVVPDEKLKELEIK